MSALQTPIPAGSDVAEVIDGKAHSRSLIMDPTGVDAVGSVAGTPGANTILGRLKAIVEAVFGLSSADSFFAITPGSTALPIVPKAIYVKTGGTLVVRGADNNPVTFEFPDMSTLSIRPRYVTGGTAGGIIGLY